MEVDGSVRTAAIENVALIEMETWSLYKGLVKYSNWIGVSALI